MKMAASSVKCEIETSTETKDCSICLLVYLRHSSDIGNRNELVGK
jgi:hypothetical protein